MTSNDEPAEHEPAEHEPAEHEPAAHELADDSSLREPGDEANRAIDDGDALRAVAWATRVIESLEASRGPHDEGVLAWRVFLVRALIEGQRFTDALAELRSVLVIRTAVSGPDARSTLRIRDDIVHVLRRAGRTVEAIMWAEHLLEDRRRIHGDDDPQTAHTRHVLDRLTDPSL
jgi:hypothetical protein